MSKTTFSVIMPVYNAEKYLDESILSVVPRRICICLDMISPLFNLHP